MKTKIAIIVFAILIAAIGILGYLYYKASYERDIYQSNQNALMSENKVFKTKNGELVVKVDQLALTIKEAIKAGVLDKDSLAVFKIKVKNVISIKEMEVLKTDTFMIAVNVDSMGCRDFNFEDEWNTVKGTACVDFCKVLVKCRHKIEAYDEKIYKGWWIFKHLDKIQTTFLVINPSDTIKSVKTINIRD